mmetsp:Transcript_66444/g.131738  ORF Transcript_66444/g.131738 Transcript_66444/m.131738 type:complete len:183 (-) Transcript_66444:223-771(-)|eukprot:CAMPEP_0174717714 /NCGR_PEP_ID=MMETSP1094-20130205/27025_1 /TAXON_ID=156173 /ORGANISM="Chrysochromulina brevifilum, Strain UTEX LB 985" /LENGTH=182 /DNA_ID=CAMNT_0015917695 /DNA_START=78 /DNA_END=626 /DNA_ORIENTATION=-
MPKKEKAPKPKKAAAEDAMPAPAATWTCTECGQEHEGEDAAAMECVACGEAKTLTEVTAGADADDKFRGIKCGVVISMEDLGDKLKVCTVDIGEGDGKERTIVTNATNVVEGSRVVVATVGAVVGDEPVTKRSVGGRHSEGMLCDGPMLGWTGGGAGAAALVPESCAAGDRPPERRLRMDGK